MIKNFYSNGKLLLTGEYVVMDGAKALALPTKFGQNLEVSSIDNPIVEWKSYDYNNQIWLECTFPLSDFLDFGKVKYSETIENRLFQILYEAHQLNPEILKNSGFMVKSKLDFPADWGLGPSSTLIFNISQWFNVDPFQLLEKTFGGSGYDIASAQIGKPIIYQVQKNIDSVEYTPSFKENIFFVHLNRKQNSWREGISNYRKLDFHRKEEAVKEITSITEQITICNELDLFQHLINQHEFLIARLLQTRTVKEVLFPEYPHSIKSLGAWGGDFILAVGSEKDKEFFRQRNYTTILNYSEMILK